MSWGFLGRVCGGGGEGCWRIGRRGICCGRRAGRVRRGEWRPGLGPWIVFVWLMFRRVGRGVLEWIIRWGGLWDGDVVDVPKSIVVCP